MGMKRRDFIGTALAAGVAAAASPLGAQQAPARDGAGAAGAAGRGMGARPPRTTIAKVEKLWNIPTYKAMNALEAAPDGLWIGDQITEKACRVDWTTGKILTEVQLESHNISGLAVGGGYIWAGSNGSVNN